MTEMYIDPDYHEDCIEVRRIADYNAKCLEDNYSHFEIARIISYASIPVPHFRDSEVDKSHKLLLAEKYYLFRKIAHLENKIQNNKMNSVLEEEDDDMDISVIVPNKSKANITKLQNIPHVESMVAYGTTPVRSSNKFSNMTKAFNTTEFGNINTVKGFFNQVTRLENDSDMDASSGEEPTETNPQPPLNNISVTQTTNNNKPFQIYKDPTIVRDVDSHKTDLKYSQLNESSKMNKFSTKEESIDGDYKKKEHFQIYHDSMRETSFRKTTDINHVTPMIKASNNEFEDTMPIATPQVTEKTAFDAFKGPLYESTKAFGFKNPSDAFKGPIFESTKVLPKPDMKPMDLDKSAMNDACKFEKNLKGPLYESTNVLPPKFNQMKGPLYESTKVLPLPKLFNSNNLENSRSLDMTKPDPKKMKERDVDEMLESPDTNAKKPLVEDMTPASKFKYFLQ